MKIGLKLYLRAIISATIIIPAAVILIVGVYALFTFSSNMMAEEVGTLAYSQVSGVKAIFDEYGTSLKSLSKLPLVQQTSLGLYANIQKDIDAQIKNNVEINPYILDMIVTDINGVVCADYTKREAGTIFFGFNETVATLNRNDIYVSDISIQSAEYGGADIFYMTHQVRVNDSTAGYVSYVIDTHTLSNYLLGTGFFGTGELFLIDSKGNALNLQSKILTRSTEIENSGIRDFVGRNKGTKNNSTDKYNTFETGGYIGAYSNIGSSTWLWVGIYPSADVNAMVSDIYLVGVIMVLIISLMCMVTMIFLTKHVINPMNQMIYKMKQLSGGCRSERFDITGNNEYTHMATTFNEMIAEVSLSEELHRTISELSDNILFEWDFHKEMMYVSDNFLSMFDVNPKQCTLLNGHFIDSIMDKEHAEQYKRDINKLLKSKETLQSEYQISTRTGTTIWISLQAHCITDRLGELLRIIGVITNIDNEKKLTLRLSERASYDFLSQLYNRTTFERELQCELDRTVTSRVAVIFIDVDDFKFINDRYGHTTGDEIIKFVSKAIKDRMMGGGFAGRFGGDEFVMCITNENLLDNIEQLAESLIDTLNDGYYCESSDITLNIRASIGIALAPEHGKEGLVLIASADEAMYYVKKNGKGNYHIYNPDDSNLIDMMHSI